MLEIYERQGIKIRAKTIFVQIAQIYSKNFYNLHQLIYIQFILDLYRHISNAGILLQKASLAKGRWTAVRRWWDSESDVVRGEKRNPSVTLRVPPPFSKGGFINHFPAPIYILSRHSQQSL